MAKTLNLTLKVWRQENRDAKGRIETYAAKDIPVDASFLEMLDIVNEGLVKEGKEPIHFDHDCREGICGMCSLTINGIPHGPERQVTTCQLHMRKFKDGDTVWNPGWQPTKTPLDSYSCRHGLGYTILEGKKDGVTARQELFVPKGDACELDRVTVCNGSTVVKELDLFSYVEFCLWDAVDDSSNFQRNYSTGEVEVEGSVIYHKTEYRERRNHYAVFWANCPVDSFDTTRDAFCGVYGGPADPQAVRAGHCSGSIAHGWAPVGALHIHVTLAPGEEKKILFGLGYIENPQQEKFIAPGVINKTRAHAMMERYATDAQVDAARAALRTHWEQLLSTYHLESGEEKLNRMVNIWHQYQCMVTFNMSRSASYYESGMGRGMSFRDSNQDLLGFVHLIPERARERIIDIASTQMEDGSAWHQYQPLTKKGNADIGGGFNDDPLWLVAGVYAYLAETGDVSILTEPVPFNNVEGSEQPLLEHLRRSVNFTITHKGPHGIPLIGRADWNDCLNLNCFSDTPGESFQTVENNDTGVAESVFIGGMFVLYGSQYADILEHYGRLAGMSDAEIASEAASVRAEIGQVSKAVKTAGWDGEWFVRAYDAYSRKVGTHEDTEGQIYIEPQGMCVMAGIGLDDGKAQQALKSVKERLTCDWGTAILAPAYSTYRIELGEISSYPRGYKENGGIFCHNNPWISIANAIAGNDDEAFAVYQRNCPAYVEDKSDVRKVEPYVYCQMVAGPEAATPGEGKNSWLTGTAAWTFVDVSQYLLGVRPTLDGLAIEPHLPERFDQLTVTRVFRGVTYRIAMKRTGERTVSVDGAKIGGNVVPALSDAKSVDVEVTF